MVLSTSELRRVYAPNCEAVWDLRPAYEALDACLRAHDYRPESGHTGARNCRVITGGSNWSLHAFFGKGVFIFWTGVRVAMALACDVNWNNNPYGPRLVTDMPRAMIDDVYKVRTNNGKRVFRWGGYYRNNKDAMHFEVVCTPDDLATGIDPATLPGAQEGLMAEDVQAIMDELKWIKDKAQELDNSHTEISKRIRNIEKKVGAVEGVVDPTGPTIAEEMDLIRRDMRKVADKLGFEPES